jgi:hypothetical protein
MKITEITKKVTDTESDEDPIRTATRRWAKGNQESGPKVTVVMSAPEGFDFSDAEKEFPSAIKKVFSFGQESLPLAPDQPTASKKASSKKDYAQVDVAAFCDGDSGVLLALQKAGILYVNQVCELGVDVIKKQTGLTRTAAQKVHDNCWKVYGGQKVPGVTSKKAAKSKKEPAKTAVA